MTALRGRIRSAALTSCAAALLCFQAGGVAAEQSVVTVVTSFPASLYEPFREAFEDEHSGYRLRVINRRTSSALSGIMDERQGPVDVFWASSPDAFERLAQEGYFAALPQREETPMIGGFPIDDPAGRYVGFAISGFGVVVGTDYLATRGLEVPASTADLAKPDYAGHLGLSAPSRSGTSHVMIEALLQQEGWEAGWASWLEIGGNLSTVTARSYSVIEGVARGRFGLGLSVDFLGRAEGGAESAPSDFVYLSDSVFLPANVGIIANAENREGAAAFVDFLLGERGQALLLEPAIRRLPIDAAIYEANPDLFNPFENPPHEGEAFVFDAGLSSSRYDLVNVMFDIAVTDRLYELRQGWAALHEVEARLSDLDEDHAVELVARARAALSAIPVSLEQSGDGDWVSGFRSHSPGVMVPAWQSGIEDDWRDYFASRHREAMALLEEAGSFIDARGRAAVR